MPSHCLALFLGGASSSSLLPSASDLASSNGLTNPERLHTLLLRAIAAAALCCSSSAACLARACCSCWRRAASACCKAGDCWMGRAAMDCAKGTPREILPGPMRRLLCFSVLPAGCCLSCAAGGMMMGGGGGGPPRGAAEGAAIERQ